jgi:hypothetical protein
MYKHLQDTNKRPRERNALLAATVWVFLRTYKNYKGPITNFVTNIKEQNSAKKIYDELDPKYFEPREDYGPLIESIRNLITEKGVNIEQSIYDNIKNELTKSRATTVTKKTKIIYNILKPIMKSRITMGLIENAIKGLV